MPSTFPGSLDNFPTNLAAGAVHTSALQNNLNDAVNKIEAKVIKEAPINVEWPEYGAVGDETTNDYAAINTAIAAVPATGGAVFLPRVHKINTGLLIDNKPVSLIGPTPSNPTSYGAGLKAAAGITAVEIRNGTNGRGARSRIENLHIVGSDTAPGSNPGVKLSANGVAMMGCAVEAFGGAGVHVRSGTLADAFVVDGVYNANCWYLERVRVYNNKTNGLFVEGIDSNAGNAVMLDSTGNTGWGVYDQSAFGNCYWGPHLDGNTLGAVRIGTQSQGCRFFGIYKEGDATPALQIDAGAAGNWVDFRVLTSAAGQTITDNSATFDNVIHTPVGFFRQNRILLGNPALATVGVNIDYTGFYLGSAQDVIFSRTAANTLGFTTCDLSIDTAGRGVKIKEGANARMGTATLVAGTVVVSTTAVATGDRIFITPVNTGGTAGFLSYTITNGTSFTVTSSSGTDTRTFNWLIVRPA